MKKLITVNFHHLQDAKKYGCVKLSGIGLYLWHLKLSFWQAGHLLVWFVCSILHGIFPFLFDFDLLSARINNLKKLKEALPNDPRLNAVDFKD